MPFSLFVLLLSFILFVDRFYCCVFFHCSGLLHGLENLEKLGMMYNLKIDIKGLDIFCNLRKLLSFLLYFKISIISLN